MTRSQPLGPIRFANISTKRLVTFLSVMSLALTLASCSRSSGGGVPASPVGEGRSVPQRLRHDDILRGVVSLPEVLRHGRQLFRASFNVHDGAGRPTSTGTGGSRTRRGAPQNFNRISGPDAGSCAACHNKPFIGGAGDNVANVFVLAQDFPHLNFDGGEGDRFRDHALRDVGNERNTVGMFGAGWVEMIAREMSVDLQRQRKAASDRAISERRDVLVALESKGTKFGQLVAKPDGSFDAQKVEGVDADLIVKPFHQKGVVASLRQFTNNALNHHHGMQSSERFGVGQDPDGDGIEDEMLDGDVTALTLYQATLPIPGRVWPGAKGAARAAAERGEKLFSTIGCASCHTPELVLDKAVYSEPSPFHPAGNLRPGDTWKQVELDLRAATNGGGLTQASDGSVRVPLYSDMRRHDMGPSLDDERVVQGGVKTSVFLTPRLWGVASQGPWLHHGRASTLDEAIRMHDGEALAVRRAYATLPAQDQRAVVEFLRTLQMLPEGSQELEATGDESDRFGDQPAVDVKFEHDEIVKKSVREIFEHGRKLFDADFNTLDGAGRPASTGTGADREARTGFESFNRLSGPDAGSCFACHNQPRSGGGGDNVANVFVLAQRLPFVAFDRGAGEKFRDFDLDNVGNERNTPGMWGAGFVELLAREISQELLAKRAAGIEQAKREQRTVVVALVSKGIKFGELRIEASGRVDVSGVQGIDGDLVVKPFHQKGVVASLRQFTNNALNHHHGIQPRERFDTDADADKDGVRDELLEGDVTALTLYQALLPVPGRVLPSDPQKRASVDEGERIFAAIGCTSCHVPELVLDDPVFTEPGPFHSSGDLRIGDVKQVLGVDLTKHGPKPRLARGQDGKVRVPVYTDFKRHDLGPLCNNEKIEQAGVATGLFVTRKLWGFASEPPFLHHGRATTIRQAIEAHGGEAAATRAAFRKLSAERQAMLLDFLQSLRVVDEGAARQRVR